MIYNPCIHQRKSYRLKNYDYSQQGAYFITICSKNKDSIFGAIQNEKVSLSPLGKIVENQWLNIKKRYTNIDLDDYVVMPNHLHGIIMIESVVGAGLAPAHGLAPAPRVTSERSIKQDPDEITKRGATARVAPTIGTIIGSFKSLCVYDWIQCSQNNPYSQSFWQRNYHDHIIRNEISLNKIREYIWKNPQEWELERNDPEDISGILKAG